MRHDQVRVNHDGTQPLGEAVRALGLTKPRPAIVVIGSADKFEQSFANRIERLFQNALAPICVESGAAVVYGGTDSGVMRLLGHVLAEFAPNVPLVGVAPKALVSFDGNPAPKEGAQADPNHTHFVTSPGDDWGSEGAVLVGVTERLAGDESIVVIVLGGGSGTVHEVSLASQREWPVLVVDGVAGTGNDIAAFVRAQQLRPARATSNEQRDIATSVAQRAVTVRQLRDVYGVRRALRWRLSDDHLLKEAWLRLGSVDTAASIVKPKLQRLKALVLFLGVLTTATAVAVPELPLRFQEGARIALLVLPGTSGALLSFIVRRRRDDRWISLRAAAQSIAREIFRFRTLAGAYWTAHLRNDHRHLFAAALGAVDRKLLGETALGARPEGFAIWPPTFVETLIDPRDELLDPLDGPTYDNVRVEDQIRYFSAAVRDSSVTVERILIAVYASSIVATVVAALSLRYPGIEVWVALAVSIGAALVAWLDAQQLERQAEQMALAAAGVRAARERWFAEVEAVRREGRRVSLFAEEVEEVLEGESTRWEGVLRQAHRSFRAYTSEAA